MIVFSGVVSDEIQAKTLKRRERHSFQLFAVCSIILIIISGILWFLLNWDITEWIVLTGLLIVVILLLKLSCRQKVSFHWEYHIIIDETAIKVMSPLWSKPFYKPLNKIKKVLDEGDCYYIIYSDINNCIICQKNLIIEGSLQDFEKLFENKISRK